MLDIFQHIVYYDYIKVKEDTNMVVYNLYLVLINEPIQIRNRVNGRILYEGSSNHIPNCLLSKIVHDMTIVHSEDTGICYHLININ